MAEQPRKRQRMFISQLMALPSMNESLLKRVVSVVRLFPDVIDTDGNWDNQQPRVLNELSDAVLIHQELELLGGETFKWVFGSPSLLVEQFCSKCPGYLQLVQETLDRHPNSVDKPWSPVIYHDEVTPGNVLAPQNKRKFTAFYFAFLEFEEALHDADSWLCLGVLRSTIVKKVKGGMSRCCRDLFSDMYCNPFIQFPDRWYHYTWRSPSFRW